MPSLQDHHRVTIVNLYIFPPHEPRTQAAPGELLWHLTRDDRDATTVLANLYLRNSQRALKERCSRLKGIVSLMHVFLSLFNFNLPHGLRLQRKFRWLETISDELQSTIIVGYLKDISKNLTDLPHTAHQTRLPRYSSTESSFVAELEDTAMTTTRSRSSCPTSSNNQVYISSSSMEFNTVGLSRE
ncbi:hypothetical protein LZ554_004017 [Drepanopeziza brunnea f. sp. 'monogermtubi']|nr:hypothetical protein LZ554_004017 [Drepanopeziza brunnea f. sp. 'monogermtubi']